MRCPNCKCELELHIKEKFDKKAEKVDDESNMELRRVKLKRRKLIFQ